jgi:hypothetical protein
MADGPQLTMMTNSTTLVLLMLTVTLTTRIMETATILAVPNASATTALRATRRIAQ